MPKKTYTAKDRLGGLHTRKTERTYTHCVVVMASEQFERARHASRYADPKWTEQSFRSDFDYYTRIATGNDPHPEGNYVKQPNGELAKVVDVERQAKRVANAQAKIADGFAGFVAAAAARDLATIEERKASGKFSTFGAVGFCGRPDLADKLAADWRIDGNVVEILPVTETPR